MGDGIKLFVYGVRSSCPRDLLEREFSKSGHVSDIFNTGKGYAFVTMADERDAKNACEDLNGQTIDGQEVKVEISHGKGTSRGGDRDRGGRDRRGGGRRDDRRDNYDRNDRYERNDRDRSRNRRDDY